MGFGSDGNLYGVDSQPDAHLWRIDVSNANVTDLGAIGRSVIGTGADASGTMYGLGPSKGPRRLLRPESAVAHDDPDQRCDDSLRLRPSGPHRRRNPGFRRGEWATGSAKSSSASTPPRAWPRPIGSSPAAPTSTRPVRLRYAFRLRWPLTRDRHGEYVHRDGRAGGDIQPTQWQSEDRRRGDPAHSVGARAVERHHGSDRDRRGGIRGIAPPTALDRQIVTPKRRINGVWEPRTRMELESVSARPDPAGPCAHRSLGSARPKSTRTELTRPSAAARAGPWLPAGGGSGLPERARDAMFRSVLRITWSTMSVSVLRPGHQGNDPEANRARLGMGLGVGGFRSMPLRRT